MRGKDLTLEGGVQIVGAVNRMASRREGTREGARGQEKEQNVMRRH